MNWYLKVVKEHYADFNGRARREEFWMFTLFNAIISIVITFVFAGIGIALESPLLGGLSYIYTLAVLVPSLAVLVRRLHDTGKSGWFFLIALIPLIGSIWLLVILCTDSVSGANKWGENPKGIGNNSTINEIGRE
ncbi:DUF805 domain-containing protein [Polaribacter sp. Z014]|uniref:DUF805 domain-containing protein n=1 Tax=unclassified Polaribacter TaxID=196858 RepID=UPI00193B0DCD|nr:MULTISPECIES: DUF805 domain-containing protein [unclassified Polaribacter]MCL7764593.1 DUF805 domain-containing protein [Polaribacter sp. Z014]QVY66371.1 DUF805 domain-containing protein [Polaribacter sp. Q13]